MPMPKEEFSRKEQYYADIAGKNGVKPKDQFSREEQYLNEIDIHVDNLERDLGGLYYLSTDSTAYKFDTSVDAQQDTLVNYFNVFFFDDNRVRPGLILHFNWGHEVLFATETAADPSTNYVKISVRATVLNPKESGESEVQYQVLYTKIKISRFDFYVSKAEFDAGEIKHVYASSSLTDGDVTRTDEKIYRLIESDGTSYSFPVGVNNQTHWDPPFDYSPTHKKYVDDKIVVMNSAPGESVSGSLGQLWIDTSTMTMYMLTDIQSDVYTWTEVWALPSEPEVL